MNFMACYKQEDNREAISSEKATGSAVGAWASVA